MQIGGVLFPGGEQGVHVFAQAQCRVGTADGCELSQRIQGAAPVQEFFDMLVLVGIAGHDLGPHDLGMVGVDSATAATVEQVKGGAAHAAVHFAPFVFAVVALVDPVAVPDARAVGQRAVNQVGGAGAALELHIALRSRGNARGRDIGNRPGTTQGGPPGQQTDGAGSPDAPELRAPRPEVKSRTGGARICRRQQAVQALAAHPAQARESQVHAAPVQALNRALTSTSVSSSAANLSSSNALKLKSRATSTPGNCSMRTLLILTDSL